MLKVAPPETLSMTTADGVRLDADIYRPEAPGAYPVLLMRQPYGRRIASTVCYAHPAWYAAHGYIVVIQDVRGRGSSQGEFTPFAQEWDDGRDAVQWAATLPGSTGTVGMYGFSYQAVTQLMAAAAGLPALKAIAPAMTGWDLKNDWAYENGAFHLSGNIAWAVQIAGQEAQRKGDAAAFGELSAAAWPPPLGTTCAARPEILERHAGHAAFYRQWLETPLDADYWNAISPAARAEAIAGAAPAALFVGGWYDTHLPGTIAAYRALAEMGAAPAHLTVGPWSHFPWGRRVGGSDFGPDAIGDIDARQIAWFDRHLKGKADGAPGAPVRLFDIGARAWKGFDAWPDKARAWRLASGGRAALDERDGSIGPDGAEGGQAPDDFLVHDPWRPVATCGGAFGVPPGPVECTASDARPDMLTYSSEALTSPLTLAGSATLALAVGADQPSFDLSCRLSRVDEAGRAWHLTEGYAHFAAAPDGPALLALRPICATLAAGDRLRLSIAGASFPAFPLNPGTGERPVDAARVDARIITLRLDTGGSRLHLPLVEAGA